MFDFPGVVKDMTKIVSCIAQARIAIGSEGLGPPLSPIEIENEMKKRIETKILSGSHKEQLKLEIKKIIKAGILKFIEFAEDARNHDEEMTPKSRKEEGIFTTFMDSFTDDKSSSSDHQKAEGRF